MPPIRPLAAVVLIVVLSKQPPVQGEDRGFRVLSGPGCSDASLCDSQCAIAGDAFVSGHNPQLLGECGEFAFTDLRRQLVEPRKVSLRVIRLVDCNLEGASLPEADMRNSIVL